MSTDTSTPSDSAVQDELYAEIGRLRDLVAHLAIPLGYRLVPVRPSPAMMEAAKTVDYSSSPEETALNIYRAMLSAAPAHQPDPMPY